MNKTELVNFVVLEANLSQAVAQRAVNALFQTITGVLSEKGKVNLAGFGSFSVQKRAARSGRHPQSGEVIAIQAKSVPTFKPSNALKEIVQQRKR
ncbi:HU family DNA-binding protein [Nitrosococcus watsonii]|uniref:Histone family protein DNA-binding protein n=1 Tax=Nitrosococcus watsoni (strain C-113) TaxID=105559 RepID=D8KC72_NITWC|nr:HU family DNA-binding protein [Nitrosococcus watsonii]ADJ29743.1 histone family protein DNA-binding protein [Nitrosococcus watsonii C-113]